MNHKVLLIDSGVTVQKIVALSLDKTKYTGLFVPSKEEAKKQILEQKPSLVLVSDRAAGIEWQRFPKEVETWLGRDGQTPSMVLLASGDIREAKHYQGVLQKPFTPQALQEVLDNLINKERPKANSVNQYQKLFEESEGEDPTHTGFEIKPQTENETARKTIGNPRQQLENLWEAPVTSVLPPEKNTSIETVSDLWGGGQIQDNKSPSSNAESQIMGTEESLAYKSLLENQVQQKLESQNLSEIVEKVLARLLPPLVERLVQERLDQLLTEQEQELEPHRNVQL